MNHNNFYYTQISDKTNGMIFLKSPKTMFLGHFRSFLPIEIFSRKSGSVTHNYIWTPNIMLSFRKIYWANPVKMYGQTERWMDKPYFIGPFRPRPEIQQLLFSKFYFKENAKIFSKNSTTPENIAILRIK